MLAQRHLKDSRSPYLFPLSAFVIANIIYQLTNNCSINPPWLYSSTTVICDPPMLVRQGHIHMTKKQHRCLATDACVCLCTCLCVWRMEGMRWRFECLCLTWTGLVMDMMHDEMMNLQNSRGLAGMYMLNLADIILPEQQHLQLCEITSCRTETWWHPCSQSVISESTCWNKELQHV